MQVKSKLESESNQAIVYGIRITIEAAETCPSLVCMKMSHLVPYPLKIFSVSRTAQTMVFYFMLELKCSTPKPMPCLPI